MSAELALILTKWSRNYFLPTLILLCLQIVLGNGDGPNCSQKSAPKDLYKNGAMNVRYMWGRVGHKIHVPVVMDSKYSYRERGIILGGLGEIQKKTCVDFYVFNHTSALSGYDYVYITKSKEGCWSHVGRVGGGQQELSLARGCINHRTAVHEMIHALGFTHEHVRADRDEYVRINWGNIQKGRERNFVKRDRGRDPYGPYDYGSIMHYDRRAFSVNGEDTIRPLKIPGAKIGLGQTMSYWDTKRILHMYKCGDGYGAEYGSDYDGGSNHLDYDDGQNQEQHPEANPVDHSHSHNHNKRQPISDEDAIYDDDYFQHLNSPPDYGETRPRQQQNQNQRHQPGRHIDQDYHYEYNPSSNRNHNHNHNGNRPRGGGHQQHNPRHQNRNQFHLPDDVDDYRDKHNPPRFEGSQSQEHHRQPNHEYQGNHYDTERQPQQYHRNNNQNQQNPFYPGSGGAGEGFDYDYQQRHPQSNRGTSIGLGLQDSPLYGIGNNAQQQYGLNFGGPSFDYRF